MARKQKQSTTEEEAEFWTWYWALGKEEQVALIRQTLEEDPETFVKLPNGKYTLWPKTPAS